MRERVPTFEFEIASDKFGLFDVNPRLYVEQGLNGYVTRDQYSSIISKINQQINAYKSKTSRRWPIGLAIIIINAILLFIILKMRFEEPDKDHKGGLEILFFLFCLLSFCCIVSDRSCSGKKNTCFKKLQSNIDKIADNTLITIDQQVNSKWTIEILADTLLETKLKLAVKFYLPQRRVSVPSIRLDPPPTSSTSDAIRIDLEQVTTTFNNEQYSEYVIAPTTPPLPTYNKAIYLFSQGTFTDCLICGTQNGVFDSKYCTQCGYSCLIESV